MSQRSCSTYRTSRQVVRLSSAHWRWTIRLENLLRLIRRRRRWLGSDVWPQPSLVCSLSVYVQECKIYDCDEDETEMNVHNLRCCCRESAKVKPRSELASLPFYLASGLERNTCCMLAGKVPVFSFFPPRRTGLGTYLLTMQAAQSSVALSMLEWCPRMARRSSQL